MRDPSCSKEKLYSVSSWRRFTMSPFLFTLSILCLSAHFSLAKKKPKDFFKLCKLSDPDLSKCILESALDAKPRLEKGIPELRMSPVDPLLIPKMSLEQGQNNFQLKFVMTNLTITGLKDTELKSFVAGKNLEWMDHTFFTKQMHFEGDYQMDGKILVLPVKGNGQVTMDFYDVTVASKTKFEVYQKKGENYIKCTSYKMSIEPRLAKSNFTNLFNGDKNLGETTNKFFNDNWRESFETYKELPQEAFGEFFKGYLNAGLSLYPMKDWFLD